MPQLGETVAEGTVTRWLFKVGDTVPHEAPLLEVSTDKVDTEVPAPVSGVLVEILVGENQTVPVGTVIALLGEMAEMGATSPVAPTSAPATVPSTTVFDSQAPSTSPSHGVTKPQGHRHSHSPRVRRAATEHGVSLGTVRGTGPSNRVTTSDVLRVARESEQFDVPSRGSVFSDARASDDRSVTPIPGAGQREPMSRLRTVIADRMMTSLHTTAQLTTVVEVDVTKAVEIRERLKREIEMASGTKLTLTAIFAKATVEALRAFPLFNAVLDGDGQTIVHRPTVRLGIAADTERGLLVPVIGGASDLSLLGLARSINDLAARARTNGLTPDELSGATFTLTNTGSRGALFDTPILGPQQAGILGTGAVVERPVVIRRVDGERVIAIRSMVYFALTYDHRLIDGADAARFLNAIKTRLEHDFSDTDVS
jgi:2-oxoglutarate dehydrogenase E2 component (dihydrolipoamide succinyltransferase)